MRCNGFKFALQTTPALTDGFEFGDFIMGQRELPTVFRAFMRLRDSAIDSYRGSIAG